MSNIGSYLTTNQKKNNIAEYKLILNFTENTVKSHSLFEKQCYKSIHRLCGLEKKKNMYKNEIENKM